mgnify:CR=1 FL=1
MINSPTAPKVVSCPSCGKKIEWTPVEVYRPFCSERCKLIDLGEWATEGYVIPDANESLEEETEEFAPPPLDRTNLFE